ncbi:MAG: hypothetical protein A3C30_03125 [Candidatus Levybacteria bacterium RIFCSPHIGHO2_02_FULL_40_18]|nr:MAG: hypothetical protein A2869_04875 [Candidatus Levybacteria bacterium RIFCSPHIGHO2_01_FULL_40_58]OGH26545.1 MAG: hypothetical protein A3C30_03125 [Candidatus Levybacteria bacterium RIFCSPHIGHO2_02_FULL_40_18]OGH31534.1 MAG: hypothetical protein A3E43_02215 [Candidatus Levybacteria bacterium RIFCSPHIGHO2_12_FULL_40_31]OGH40299.1 MAG: hypothetical protein A2894_00765 [Candidatus Levybacteria bacterium RIFCSPLOWO2_01_FULL_40_64]OGH49503.1 MAG: hypothetical protein A3I54_03175 [Candidatus Lev
MKNLLIYFNPKKEFTPEYEDLTKIQIDNSLSLGWDSKDMILVTNFEYNYRGIKALVIGEGDYEVFDRNKSSKIPIINRMFADRLIEDELYWFHDLDAFQLVPFDMNLDKDAGFTNHGWSKRWNAGSFFFKKEARDIFQRIWEIMGQLNSNEQNALTYMWKNNIDNINNRYQLINITFNIGIYYIPTNLKRAQLPVKVAHFHPHKKRHFGLFKEVLPERLVKILNSYGLGDYKEDTGILSDGYFNEVARDLKGLKVRNWHRVWEPFMRKYNCSRVAELGIYKGDNFAEMIAHQPTLAVAVDAWKDSGVHPRKYDDYTQKEFDEQYEIFIKRIKKFPFVQVVRDYTVQSAKLFPDEYFDFVYIDADHSTEACYKDMISWYPKVKTGKFLVGHDFRRGFGVIDAVNRFMKEHYLEMIFMPPSTWALIKK